MRRPLFLCSLFLFFAFIVSCERTLVFKDPALSSQTETEEMKMLTEITKQYYTKELRKTIESGQRAALERAQGLKKSSKTTAVDKLDGTKAYALWKEAVSVTVGGIARTEVPLSYANRTVSLIKVARDSVGELPDRSMLSTIFDRLVVFHDGDGFRQKIVRFHPDKSYLDRHGFDASHNYLHKLDKDFSGYLEYLEVSGERKAIIRVVNGKPVRKFGVRGGNQQGGAVTKEMLPNGQFGAMSDDWVCDWICEDIWVEICVGNPNNPDDPDDMYCEDQWYGEECWEDCYPIEGEPEPEYCEDPANWEECWGGAKSRSRSRA